MDIQDKSLGIGFNAILCSLFALLPSPIIYGKIIDGSCLLWQDICGGEMGNCIAYDAVQLRTSYMFTTAGLMSCGLIADMAVCYESKDLVIFRDDQPDELNSRRQSLKEASTLLSENNC